MSAESVVIRFGTGEAAVCLRGCVVANKWEPAGFPCVMTEGGLAADPELHCLPASDICDSSIGRIIDLI
jgi:hypothetical protein